jgi:glyoxylase-like metal-dependent hydrolase (beta-lactamase superfamily II)
LSRPPASTSTRLDPSRWAGQRHTPARQHERRRCRPQPDQHDPGLAFPSRSCLGFDGERHQQGRLPQCRADRQRRAGVRLVAAAGHTPGHSAFLVTSGKDQLMVSNDTMYHRSALCASRSNARLSPVFVIDDCERSGAGDDRIVVVHFYRRVTNLSEGSGGSVVHPADVQDRDGGCSHSRFVKRKLSA